MSEKARFEEFAPKKFLPLDYTDQHLQPFYMVSESLEEMTERLMEFGRELRPETEYKYNADTQEIC